MAEQINNVELVMWTPSKGKDIKPPTVYAMQSALHSCDYRSEYAETVPHTTAFRRAVKELETKETKITFHTNGKLKAQLDRIIEDQDTHRIKREFVASWAMNTDTHAVEGTTDISNEVATSTEQYTWADVSTIIKQILDKEGMGAHSPRKSGAVYFVPTRSKAELDRLERCFGIVGLNVLRYSIPDTGAQRQEIADAIAGTLEAETDGHAEAIANYTAETKPGTIANRLESINATTALANRLAAHLGEKLDGIKNRLYDLSERARAIHAEAENFRPTGGRRIMTQTPSMM